MMYKIRQLELAPILVEQFVVAIETPVAARIPAPGLVVGVGAQLVRPLVERAASQRAQGQ